jgi:hypothetical protein
MTSRTVNKITYFNSIPVIPKQTSIMSRLGYRSGLTALSAKDRSFIEETITLGLALCRNQGATGRFDLKSHTIEEVVLTDGTYLESRQLARMLQKSDEILFMAGTAGPEITGRIHLEMNKGNAAAAVVLDAVASVSADMTLDWIMGIFNKILQKEGRLLTRRRYSPGFGDLPLSNQAVIFRLLGLEQLNLSLNESMMLAPEKSVLAIAGIERIKTK